MTPSDRKGTGRWLLCLIALLCAVGWSQVSAADHPSPAPAEIDEGATCESSETVPAATESDGAERRQGYCKCGCGARCTTSADCGGAACVPFITCC